MQNKDKNVLTPVQILTKYWSFSHFRPYQEEIINSILAGNDTLAILPTGGGKSICYQVPGMMMEGICVVISPLIALMKDQVETLVERGIAAIAIYSGMSKKEIDIALDNCIYGNIKFLYISPERLASELAIIRIAKMKVNLLAVDEAHCISQWGYDFRPTYLKISDIRQHLHNVPILALTATATPKVSDDITEKLLFKKKVVFKQSFARENLAYFGINEENKLPRLLSVVKKVQGSGLVYVRSRKGAKEIADFLMRNGISADYYHAGLDTKTRSLRQENWKSGRTNIMVATNAFGMGIDKANVRLVVHYDIPNSLEAYYQEAGRAGRDGIKAFAVFLYNENDKDTLRIQAEASFPDLAEIKRVYQALANYLQIAVGSGEGMTYEYDISDFCNTYNLNPTLVFNSLHILELEGLISLSDAVFTPSRVKILLQQRNLYDFQVKNKKYDNFIKLMLRSYGSMDENYAKIKEEELATRFEVSLEHVINLLKQLEHLQVINYLPRNESPKVTLLEARMNVNDLVISKENLFERKRRYLERMHSVIDFVENNNQCRSILLLSYFGEQTDYRCGICDYCIKRNKLALSELVFESLEEEILHHLMKHPMKLEDLVSNIKSAPSEEVLHVIEWMLDNKNIQHASGGMIEIPQ